jgi:hypothetical protein
MATLLADVFVDPVSHSRFHVFVAHEKTGEDMPDSGFARIFRKKVRTAAADSGGTGNSCALVFHFMPENAAYDDLKSGLPPE